VPEDSIRHPRRGQLARPDDLIDVAKLVAAYYSEHPDASEPSQRIRFGTSGHRGTSLATSFNEDHIAAMSQAVCEVRAASGTDGPLFLGRDPHALSEPALETALEVFAANGVVVMLDGRDGFTPTPAVSRAIIKHVAGGGRADGVVITPSHNPPRDGGFKYNPPHGGPAGTEVTRAIEERGNELLAAGLAGVRRMPVAQARAVAARYDYVGEYVGDLPTVVDLDAIRAAGVRIGADPLGGASVAYWEEIAARYGLELTVVNSEVDPTWRFMSLDWDGNIRMDCSSPYAMASLVARRDEFDVATGNDADADRHGIVTPDGGLMSPNHYLAVAIDYLFRSRSGWPAGAAVGKTVVSSSMIDRVAAGLERPLYEVPVGFKWFVDGLTSGTLGFGGEESAGASLLRRDGTVWTTDKDGIALCLLAAEITAATGGPPSQRYADLTRRYGDPQFTRIDTPADAATRQALGALSPERVAADTLAGEPVRAALTAAPGNGAPIGGLKVSADSGWFAARPSGTEDIYKLYAESFRDAAHLDEIVADAQRIVAAALQ
jgi:phosphoglucomutase